MTYGLKVGYKSGRIESSVNYSRITQTAGISCRESGVGTLCSLSFPVNAMKDWEMFMLSWESNYYTVPKRNFRWDLALAIISLPDVKNTALNKYGMPSYMQANLDIALFF